MSQIKPCATSGQDVYATFQIELIDSQGVCQDRIGYRFALAGATAGAEAWNRQERRELTAIVRPFDGESENVFDRKLREDQEASDIETDTYRVLVLNHSGTYFVVDKSFSLGQAENWAATWSHKSAVAVVVAYEDIAEHYSSLLLLEASTLAPNALDDEDDSDVMEDSEDATEASTEGDFSDGDHYDLEVSAEQRKAVYFQEALAEHLEHVKQAIEHVRDAGSVGVIAASLKVLCEVLGDTDDAFDDGLNGNVKNDALAEAVGFEVATA